MASIDKARALFAAGWALAGVSICGPAFAQAHPASAFAVANIRIQAEAENAVEAKKIATTRAEAQALRILLARLTDFRSRRQLPEIPPEQLEGLVADIDIRGEGVSGTSYVANFGVTFSERGIRSLLSQAGVTPIDDRGPEITILPVYIEAGAASTSDRNPWRKSFGELDLAHALIPAKIAPARSDITAAIANAYVKNPSASLETLKSQYRTTQIVLAVAEADAGGEALSLQLVGVDSLGPFTLKRRLKSREGVDANLMQTAANLAFGAVQQRWKLTRDAAALAASAGGESVGGASGGGLVPIEVTAQFSGLKEWQTLRARLQRVPGIVNLEVKAVNPRSASIGFEFPGGAERLGNLAAGQGLSIENGPDGWIVKTR